MSKHLIFLVLFSISPVLIAQATPPVKHNHNGRVHTHSLPATGVNHNHNKGSGNRTPAKTNSGWVLLAKTNERYPTTYYGKGGSLKTGQHSITLIGQVDNSLTKRVNLYRWSISIRDCINGYGKFVSYDLSGKHLFSNDFASGGKSVGSGVADAMCKNRTK